MVNSEENKMDVFPKQISLIHYLSHYLSQNCQKKRWLQQSSFWIDRFNRQGAKNVLRLPSCKWGQTRKDKSPITHFRLDFNIGWGSLRLVKSSPSSLNGLGLVWPAYCHRNTFPPYSPSYHDMLAICSYKFLAVGRSLGSTSMQSWRSFSMPSGSSSGTLQCTMQEFGDYWQAQIADIMQAVRDRTSITLWNDGTYTSWIQLCLI